MNNYNSNYLKGFKKGLRQDIKNANRRLNRLAQFYGKDNVVYKREAEKIELTFKDFTYKNERGEVQISSKIVNQQTDKNKMLALMASASSVRNVSQARDEAIEMLKKSPEAFENEGINTESVSSEDILNKPISKLTESEKSAVSSLVKAIVNLEGSLEEKIKQLYDLEKAFDELEKDPNLYRLQDIQEARILIEKVEDILSQSHKSLADINTIVDDINNLSEKIAEINNKKAEFGRLKTEEEKKRALEKWGVR